MLASRSEGQPPATASGKRFRSACDYCHDTKVKCTGTRPCEKCEKIGFDCTYSVSNRMGRPKDTRNKKTLERVRQSQEAKAAREAREVEETRLQETASDIVPTMATMAPYAMDTRADHLSPFEAPSLDMGLDMVSQAMSRDTTNLTNSSNDTHMGSLGMLSDTGSFSPLGISCDPKAVGGVGDFWDLDVGDDVLLWCMVSLIPEQTHSAASLPSLTPDILSADASCSSSEINTPFPFPNDFGPEPAVDPSSLVLNGLEALGEDHLKDPGFPSADFLAATRSSTVFGQPDSICEKCMCPENQTNLMLRLRRCGKSGQPTLDRGAALGLVSQAIASWQEMTSCGYCSTCVRAGEDYVLEVVMMATMNLRLLLSIIHTLLKNLATLGQNSEAHEHPDQYRSASRRAKSAADILMTGSYIGAYEMNHEEDKLVASLLLFRALNSMQAITNRLRQQLHETEHCLENGPGDYSSDEDLFSPFDSTPSTGAKRRCDCVGEANKKRSHKPNLSHAAEEKLHEIWHVGCTLQRLEEALRPLKGQAKAYLSHHT